MLNLEPELNLIHEIVLYAKWKKPSSKMGGRIVPLILLLIEVRYSTKYLSFKMASTNNAPGILSELK